VREKKDQKGRTSTPTYSAKGKKKPIPVRPKKKRKLRTAPKKKISQTGGPKRDEAARKKK